MPGLVPFPDKQHREADGDEQQRVLRDLKRDDLRGDRRADVRADLLQERRELRVRERLVHGVVVHEPAQQRRRQLEDLARVTALLRVEVVVAALALARLLVLRVVLVVEFRRERHRVHAHVEEPERAQHDLHLHVRRVHDGGAHG